jgi:hypothetical protein
MNFIHDVNDDARCDVGHVIHDTFLHFDIFPCQLIILESSQYFLHMYVIIQKIKEIMTPQGVPNNISNGKLRKLYLLKNINLKRINIFRKTRKGCLP